MARLLNLRPDADVEPLLEAHLDLLRKQNLSPRTIRERRFTVLRAARVIGHPLSQVSKSDLSDYQDSQRHLKPSAMHNLVVHISQYLKWLHDSGHIETDPSKGLVRPRNPHVRLPRPMSDVDIRRAIAAAYDPDVHLWIGLGAFCGLRCMEMAKLRGEDVIRGEHPHLIIVGKGQKERTVPIPTHMLLELDQYPNTGYLFARMDGKPGPPSAMRVSERINDHLHACGIASTAHALRHRFGTKLYQETSDPFLVAEVMGHSSTDTTRLYVQVLSDRASAPIEAISKLDLTGA